MASAPASPLRSRTDPRPLPTRSIPPASDSTREVKAARSRAIPDHLDRLLVASLSGDDHRSKGWDQPRPSRATHGAFDASYAYLPRLYTEVITAILHLVLYALSLVVDPPRRRIHIGRDRSNILDAGVWRDMRDPALNVTIFSDTETRDWAERAVSLQVKYIGQRPAISGALADCQCSALGIVELLTRLNVTLLTAYTLETPGLRDALQVCLDQGFDFGTAYGFLRPYWRQSVGFEGLNTQWLWLKQRDTEMREAALDKAKQRITKPRLPPRRVWDLYANRVLPWWVVCGFAAESDHRPIGISHAWMAQDGRRVVRTPINAGEWPVPIPHDTDLDSVRVELLNVLDSSGWFEGYVWLDVLCLRQMDCESGQPQDEPPVRRSERLAEWKLDVPTIGTVYANKVTNVVVYFSGLGRPFTVTEDGLKSTRHWLNRAWTLQELTEHVVLGGVTPDSPHASRVLENINRDVESNEEQASSAPEGSGAQDGALTHFHDRLLAMQRQSRMTSLDRNIIDMLGVMCVRNATNDLDRIAGLAYLLAPEGLPVYDPDIDPEVAWNRLVEGMDICFRRQLLFLYPRTGDGRHAWSLSWKQAMNGGFPASAQEQLRHTRALSGTMLADGVYDLPVRLIKNCTIQGLHGEGREGSGPPSRRGTVRVVAGTESYAYTVVADHDFSLPDGLYDIGGLIPIIPEDTIVASYWVVGKLVDGVQMRKISVLRAGIEEVGKGPQKWGKVQRVHFI